MQLSDRIRNHSVESSLKNLIRALPTCEEHVLAVVLAEDELRREVPALLTVHGFVPIVV